MCNLAIPECPEEDGKWVWERGGWSRKSGGILLPPPSFRDFSDFRREIVVDWLVRWAVGLVSSRGQNRVAETFIVPLSSLYIRVSGLSWAVNKRGRRS